MFSDEFVQTLPRQALEQIQLRKFQVLLEKVLESNAFYKSKLNEAGITSASDVETLADYRKLPFTLKSEVAADQLNNPPYGTNMTFPREHYTKIHQTSGTTGLPLQWLDTDEDWDWWTRCWATIYTAAGVNADDRVFFAFSFGPFIVFWSAHSGAQYVGAQAIPGGGMSSLQRLRAILMHEVTVLICTPTYALHLAEVASEEGLDIRGSSVRIAIHAGEPGASLPATRQRIEEAWGVKCFDHAGATEVGAWGFECDGYPGMYLNEGEFLFEVVDPETGKQATEGELVISNLGRIGMPVIRYRTGDQVKLNPHPGPGGITYRNLLGGVIGRVDDVLVVRGINVYPSAIENIIRRVPWVGEFAVDIFRRHELDCMDIRIELSADDDAEAISKILATEIRNALELRADVIVVPFGTLPRFDLKNKRFTDHRPAQ